VDSITISTVVIAGAIVLDITIRVLAVIFIPMNRRPQTATAWLLAIFLIPYLGIIVFLAIGRTKLPRGRRIKQDKVNEMIRDSTVNSPAVVENPGGPEWLPSVVALNRNLGAMPLLGGNSAALHDNYAEGIAAMTAAVDGAQSFAHVEFYVLNLDATSKAFFDAMARAVQRGVTVRVLLDHIASMRVPHYRRTIRYLTDHGIDWQLMLPVQPLRGKYQRLDLRNHRKLVVIDGRTAFTGSQNMIDSTYNKRSNVSRGLTWKDMMVRFDGPIVAGINALFLTDWYTERGELLINEDEPLGSGETYGDLEAQVVPSGPGFEGENNLRLFNALLYNATEQIIISSPYFVPDDSMLYAITTAAQRGLRVELFVSEIGDQFMVHHAQRSYYEALLRAGVIIWLYRAPTVLHAKHFTIDDEVAVVGSSNMDMRSFTLNLEISVMVHSRSFVEELRRVEQGYREHSRELSLEEWLRRPLLSIVLDNIMRLTAGLQ